MNRNNQISHAGRVVEITPDFTTVEIICGSACSSCHAASLCGMSEYEKKAVQIPTRAWESYEVGEEVNVVLKASMGHKAVWLSYVLPLIFLFGVLMTALKFGVGELLSALAAFAAVAVYYTVIYLMRESLRSEYVFEVEKKTK